MFGFVHGHWFWNDTVGVVILLMLSLILLIWNIIIFLVMARYHLLSLFPITRSSCVVA
jgi:hypothetical protein